MARPIDDIITQIESRDMDIEYDKTILPDGRGMLKLHCETCLVGSAKAKINNQRVVLNTVQNAGRRNFLVIVTERNPPA